MFISCHVGPNADEQLHLMPKTDLDQRLSRATFYISRVEMGSFVCTIYECQIELLNYFLLSGTYNFRNLISHVKFLVDFFQP